jgi:hypothetical protein
MAPCAQKCAKNERKNIGSTAASSAAVIVEASAREFESFSKVFPFYVSLPFLKYRR